MLDDAARAIEAVPASDRWGSLCFFGEWFGGRRYESSSLVIPTSATPGFGKDSRPGLVLASGVSHRDELQGHTLCVKRVYLAGPPNADEYRSRATKLARHRGLDPVDPMRRDFRGRTEGNEREIVEGDLADIDTCDVVLAAFTEPDEGTAMEAWYAHTRGIPVVAYSGGAWVHPWTVFVAASVHKRLEDAIEAL
jgi:hypothetical protein